MVEKYVPKVGDKVRATLGENVLVGRIDYTAESASVQSWLVVPDGVEDVDPYLLSGADGWHFEQIVSVPTKFGAVIRRADGVLFTLCEMPDSDGWFGSGGLRWAEQDEATAGGFTVLFDGVDE